MHLFRDFKGFAKAGLDLFSPTTVLIGPNGSGKSNAIEGVALLSALAHGRALHEITDVGQGGLVEVRGGLQSCARYGQATFTLGFTGGYIRDHKGATGEIDYRVTVRVQPRPRIASEVLRVGKHMIFQTLDQAASATSSDIRVEYNNFARGGRNPHVTTAANRSVLSQYDRFAAKNKYLRQWSTIISSILKYLRASFVFDPQPKAMRGYQRIGDSVLLRNGSNLSAVLFDLVENAGAKGRRKKSGNATADRLLAYIRQVPGSPHDQFEFVTTELNDVILALRDKGSGQSVDARLLSDGTLRCLAVLTALETVQPQSRVIIEEFDNGLHPSRVGILAQALGDCSQRRDLNVLVTTHNPATLNALSTKQLESVVTCVYRGEGQGFDLVRLSDLPRFEEMLERGRVGDLVTRQVAEEYLAPNFEQSRKHAMRDWLNGLA